MLTVAERYQEEKFGGKNKNENNLKFKSGEVQDKMEMEVKNLNINGRGKSDEEVELQKEKILSLNESKTSKKLEDELLESKSQKEYLPSCGSKNYVRKSRSVSVDEMINLFEVVNASGLPNFQKCRIALPNSNLNMALWRDRLQDYHDKVVCDYLQFGFPLDFDRTKSVSDKERKNHKGALNYPNFINKYLEKETSARRIAGPFRKNPLSVPLIVSPMNTVPKSCSDERRVIVDLSWPHGASVNDGISKNVYLGELINLHYASVEQVCQMVMTAGRGAHIYKRDLRQAYRQIPVDPRDYRFLGYCWDDALYFDSVLAMGQRNAAMACSRTTDAVVYMHKQDGFSATNYLDDLIGVAHPQSSKAAYMALGELLENLGLEENLSKACEPATSQIVLGVLIDSVEGTVAVPAEKLKEIVSIIAAWQTKTRSNKVGLQSLIGTLQFVTKCVRQSRIFLNRLLETLRDMKTSKVITLSPSFRKDLRWWSMFIEKFNGVSYIPPAIWDEPDVAFSTDSCLHGCGGICGVEYFHVVYPDAIKNQRLAIHKLEMLAVLIAVRIWGEGFQGMRLQIFCDNAAAVDVINSSKTRDPFLATCLRELWLEVSKHNFELRAVHLPGEENRVADWLSRWTLHEKYPKLFHQFISGDHRYVEIDISQEMFKFSEEL